MLVLEDLHWSDRSTLELLSHSENSELALAPLDEAGIGAYLTRRSPGGELGRPLAPILRHQTGGNPLFMVNVVDHLVNGGWIAAVDGRWTLRATAAEIGRAVPESLRCTIERHVQALPSARPRKAPEPPT